jgi:hypothetical protein
VSDDTTAPELELADAERWMREERDDHGRDYNAEALILAELERLRSERAAADLDARLVAAIPALLAMCRLWQTQQASYPDTDHGRAAAAAVRLCAREVRAAIAAAVPGDLTDELERLRAVEKAAQTYVMAGLCGDPDTSAELFELIRVARTDGPGSPTVVVSPGGELERLRARVAELEAGPVVYGVRRLGDGVADTYVDRSDAEYWRGPHEELVQAHRGPWEVVSS